MATNNDRVTDNTAFRINQKIANRIEQNISYYSENTDLIEYRLNELEQEWDIERALEAHAGAVSVMSVGLGLFRNKLWFLFPAVLGGFMLQHSIQGWCPPLPILRRMGFRTQSEIDREKYALKALRGDFDNINTTIEGEFERDDNVVHISQKIIEAVR